MKCIDEVPASEWTGKRVIVRADYNLPLNAQGEVADGFRLNQGWKTVKYLTDNGARVIILTHVGRDPEETTEPIAKAIQQFAKTTYVPDLVGPMARDVIGAMHD